MTSDSTTTIQKSISFTPRAIERIADLVAEEGNPATKLRVAIQGGGCAGFQYGFSFDTILNEDDVTLMQNEQPIAMVIDALSLQYLTGAEIDYEEELRGSQFVINNPNATRTCGCGASFG